MKGTLVGGRVAEEADHHLPGLALADGECRAHGNRQARAHNAVRAQVAHGNVGDVHGTAAAVAIAGFLAE